MPSEPPISWPVVFRPDSIPVSWSAAPVSTATETRDEDDPEADAGDEHAGQHVGGVAAVRADAGEQQHPGGGDREPGGERDPDAGVGDEVAGGVDAGADRDGERQERQPGLERPGPEHVLQVQRGEQERAEQHGGGGEHHHEAAADGAVAEALDAQQRLGGAQLERGEGGQAGERRGADARASGSRSSRWSAPGRGRRRARRGWRWPAARRAGRGRATAAAPASAGRRCVAPAARSSADGQVDEEDRAPVDELGQHAAEQDADRGAGAADRAPDAERLGALGAVEGAW